MRRRNIGVSVLFILLFLLFLGIMIYPFLAHFGFDRFQKTAPDPFPLQSRLYAKLVDIIFRSLNPWFFHSYAQCGDPGLPFQHIAEFLSAVTDHLHAVAAGMQRQQDRLHVIFLRVGNDAGVRRIYAVYVRINFAYVGVNSAGNGNGRRIRAAPSQRRNIAVTRNALEPCDDDDVAFVQRFHNAVRF